MYIKRGMGITMRNVTHRLQSRYLPQPEELQLIGIFVAAGYSCLVAQTPVALNICVDLFPIC